MEAKNGNGLFVIDERGKFYFTAQGKEQLSGLFELAGIDFDNIRSFDDYIRAREHASPYFGLWLKKYCESLPDSNDYRMIKACLLERPLHLE
ncbi:MULTISPECIES: hypothetical protein [unclassified Oleiphilus]|uniref:hypothetical protein n=1 Tax=unclassified Oleiphilus TaxID=2631174 RepID=UPI0007C39E82|nr:MULTISPECIES: hypothetical protein [unclassified Oleiphilus]KZY47969.1 hypothetical protein A3732_06230 [Oleiphilus sp. HI0050]KZY73329.1 hypothetical protein A3740_19210 [Oleiphilus sp. HI0068]KZY76658.1 hypothetical protein A3741_10700 [Oleiphilus sp. HI0069]KZZ31065.1 hypothetical protein A3755_01810 [Oleiphilus sp. HI0085]KZY77111.1 hypothetical protein A3741_10090 [Oleiphilus sp. HI0069]